MKKDIKYIIKRILIGVGIALAIMFIKQNVYALVDDPLADQYNTLLEFNDSGSSEVVIIKDFYANWRNNSGTYEYTLPYENSNYSSCEGKTITSNYYRVSAYSMPSYPSTSELGSNWSCSSYSKRYVTLAGVKVTINYNFEKDKYYKINLWYLKEKEGSLPRAPLENQSFLSNPPDINIKHNNIIEDFGGNYGSYTLLEGPYNQSSDSSYYDWLGISYTFKVLEDTNQVVLWYGYNPNSTKITGVKTYPSNFTSSTESPLFVYNTFESANSSNMPFANLTHTRPFIYEFDKEQFDIDTGSGGSDYEFNYFSDVQSSINDTILDINDEIYGINQVFDNNLGVVNVGNYNIATLITFPINFLKTFNSDTICSPISINLPINNATISIPCFKDFFIGIFGENLLGIVQTLIMGSIALFLIFDFYDFCMKILSPDGLITYEDDVVSVNKSTGEVIHHKRRGTR